MKIAIIDYDAGNLANVVRAATRAGLDVVVTRNPEEIREANAMILPGVGAMKDAMDHLSGYGLTDIIREEVRKGKKLAGICLGMQALYEVSEEGVKCRLWDFFRGVSSISQKEISKSRTWDGMSS